MMKNPSCGKMLVVGGMKFGDGVLILTLNTLSDNLPKGCAILNETKEFFWLWSFFFFFFQGIIEWLVLYKYLVAYLTLGPHSLYDDDFIMFNYLAFTSLLERLHINFMPNTYGKLIINPHMGRKR